MQKPQTENVSEQIGEAIGYAEIIVERKLQNLKLDVAEYTARFSSRIITALVIGFFVGLIILTLNIGIGFLIAEITDLSVGMSFLILSMANFLLMGLLFGFRHQLFTNPILSMVIKEIFSTKNSINGTHGNK